MGRRSLPKIDRSISVDAHFDELEELSPPWLPNAYFGSFAGPADVPLEIEIGSGKGLFLLNASGGNPERRY